jgi:hypothetical protein
MRSFIPKDCAVDPVLAAVIEEVSPDEEGVRSLGAQDNLLAGADELGSLPTVGVSVRRIMALVHFKAVQVSVLCQPPERHASSLQCCNKECRLDGEPLGRHLIGFLG